MYSQEKLDRVVRESRSLINDRTPRTSSPNGEIRAGYDIPMEIFLNAKVAHGEEWTPEYKKDMARRGIIREIPYVSRKTAVSGTILPAQNLTRFGRSKCYAFRKGKLVRVA